MIRKRRASPEAAIQVAVMRALRERGGPKVFAFHCPNGGLRSVTEARRMKSQGVTAGVPDICVVIAGIAHFLELKAPGEKPSDEQLFTMRKLREAGAECDVADSLAIALSILQRWGALRPLQIHEAAA